MTGRLIPGFAIAVAAGWALGQILPSEMQVVLGVGLFVGAALPMLSRRFLARSFDFPVPLQLTGAMLLFDHLPPGIVTIGLILAGILLGIGFGIATWRIPALRAHWLPWAGATVLLTLVIVSGALGLRQMEHDLTNGLSTLWLLPSTLFALGFLLVFVRAATLSGILPTGGPNGSDTPKNAPAITGVREMFSPLPFVITALGCLVGTNLVRGAAGPPAIWIATGIALLAGIVFLALGLRRGSLRRWVAIGLVWGSVQAFGSFLPYPWSQGVATAASIVLLVILIATLVAPARMRGLIPAQSVNEATLAFTVPVATLAGVVSAIM